MNRSKYFKLIKNRIKCNHCGDIIESKHRHDFVKCSCGKISIDGGLDYQRISFMDINDFLDLSVYKYFLKEL